jgi:hypothetical protein
MPFQTATIDTRINREGTKIFAVLTDIRPCDKTITQTEAAHAPVVAVIFQLAASIRRRKKKMVPAVAPPKAIPDSIANPIAIRKFLMDITSSNRLGLQARLSQKQKLQSCTFFAPFGTFRARPCQAHENIRFGIHTPKKHCTQYKEQPAAIMSHFRSAGACTAAVTVFVVVEVKAPNKPGPMVPKRLQIPPP